MISLHRLLLLLEVSLLSGKCIVQAAFHNRHALNGGGPLTAIASGTRVPRLKLSQHKAFLCNPGSSLSKQSDASFGWISDCSDDSNQSVTTTLGPQAGASMRYRFTLSLNIKKLRKMKRRQINRMNKDLELFKLVKQRRLKNANRLVDIRSINFLNDKCNLALMRLPVSPMVDLNGIVPFKTVPQMTSQVPFNPGPVLHAIGYRFKPDRNSKYERFCEPYPMDEILQVVDARSMGALSRMSGKYKITGDGTRMPTPMDSQVVAPGASVGKGYGFGLTKKPEPKNKAIPLSNFDPYAQSSSNIVDSLDELEQLRGQALKYAEDIGKLNGEQNIQKGDKSLDDQVSDVSYAEEIKDIMKQTASTSEYDTIEEHSINIKYLDDACDEGDIMRNPRYLGEYKNKYWYHPFYGNATMPGEEKQMVEEYNKANPDKPLTYEPYKVDLIYCHSNGTIVYLGEDEDPYLNQADDFVLEGEDPREPRFIIQAQAGFIKENDLQLGQILPVVNSEMREKYYDNIFFVPKSVRNQYQLHLPDGTPVR